MYHGEDDREEMIRRINEWKPTHPMSKEVQSLKQDLRIARWWAVISTTIAFILYWRCK